MSFLFGGDKQNVTAPPPVTPPPTVPTMADPSVQAAGTAASRAAAAAAGKRGYSNTVKTSTQGADTPSLAEHTLFGS